MGSKSSLIACLTTVSLLGFLLPACGSTPASSSGPGGDPETELSALGGESALTEGVQRRQLSNGLTVLVREESASPLVAIVTHLKSGYFHEPDELAGISHVLEHMMFNGTPDRPDPEQISREIKGYGGILNAGTIYDRTSYFTVVPSERFEQALAVQADSYMHPLFDGEVLERELGAILQESRRKLDDPDAYGREKMFELAFERHRMARWRMGREDGLRALRREDLLRWHQDHYRPANTILSIVGDVDAETVFARVEDLYGGHPRGELRQHDGPDEPRQTALRYQRVSGDIARNQVFVGFHTPGPLHEDNAALAVLAQILGGGASSRLSQQLKERLGVITEYEAQVYQYGDIGVFEIGLLCGDGDLSRATREVFVEIERIKQFGISAEELSRARSVLQTERALQQEELLSQASTLALYEALGGYRELDAQAIALARVSPEDLLRVAREYLQIEKANVLEYVAPTVVGDVLDSERMQGHIRGTVLAAAQDLYPIEAPAPAPSYLPRLQLASWAAQFSAAGELPAELARFEFENGASLIVDPNPTTPTSSVGIYFRGGRICEVSNSSGATRLVQRLMTKQTQNRDPRQLAAEIEGLGTSIETVTEDDYFGFSMETLSRNLPYAFDLLFDVVANPRISDDQISREKEYQLAAIASAQDRTSQFAAELLRAALFAGHPYGLPPMGTDRVIRYIRTDRLEDFHVELGNPEQAVIVVSGQVDPQRVYEFLSLYMEQWSNIASAFPAGADAFYDEEVFPAPEPLTGEDRSEVSRDRAQSALMLAYRTVPRSNPDHYAFEILRAITGGLGGTLFEEIRTRRGLAYQVNTMAQSRAMAGWFGAYVACSPENAEQVENLVREHIEALASEAPDAESIERARKYLAGSQAIRLQTNRARGLALAELALLGLPVSDLAEYAQRLEGVDRATLQRVAQTYIADQPPAVGLVQGSRNELPNP